MPASIEKMPGEPIVVISVDPSDFSPESAQSFSNQLTKLLDTQPEPVILINIVPEGYELSMNELLDATQLVKQMSHLFHHTNIKGMAAVTTNDVLKAAYQGLGNEAFGGISIKAFDTLEEALTYARS